MIHWSLLSEYFALILIIVIMLFFYDKRRIRSFRRQLFWNCLWLSVASILLNIASVFFIENVGRFSVGTALLMNSAYFMVSILMCTAIAFYLFQYIFEYVYDKNCMRRIMVGLALLVFVNFVLVLWNAYSGMIFYIDSAGNYGRGPLNAVGFATPLAEVILFLIFYIRYRKRTGRAVARMVWTIPPIVVLLVAYQMAYPDQLLNGALCALSDLIIFINFQNSLIERDSLTEVYNRKSFLEDLTLRRAGQQEYQIILLVLRHFSRVNQAHGHGGGDAILFQIAAFLRNVAGNGRVFRFGGVEFALILPYRGDDSRLERICQRFREDWMLGETPVSISACMAELTDRGQDWTPEEIVAYLEYSIRLAREENRELVRFDGDISRRYHRREYLIQTLQAAIREKRFRVWYQPVYHRDTDSFRSAEALVRLPDGEGGMIPPDEFIPLAEETGMIDALSWIVLEEVCRLLGNESVSDLESVSINLSMQQLLNKDLGQRIEEMLNRYGVAPEQLKLEITERVLADNIDYVREIMTDLSHRNVNFLLDDFGTGYSNFSSVLDLPFEAIKLDRSLMEGLADSPRSKLLADTIIPFFHELGDRVVAEGIETQRQAELALNCGADWLQGFLFARPMPEREFLDWLSAHKKHDGKKDLLSD